MHAEADIEQAAMHGVSAETIKALRISHLVENVHYLFLGSGALSYTDEGEDKLAELLKADPPTAPKIDPAKKEGGAETPPPSGEESTPLPPTPPQPPVSLPLEATEPPREASLVVIRKYPNPIWVQCRHPDKPKAFVDIRVNPSNRLIPGDSIECAFEGDQWLCCQPGLKPRIRP